MRVAVLVAVLLVVPATAPVAGAADASVEATVDGTSIDGARLVVADDPTLSVSGQAPERVEKVTVRVDGSTRRVFSPNATAFSRDVPLSLDEGDHRVAVIVRAGGRTVEAVGTVAKDTTGPRVAYRSPATTAAVEGPPDMVPVTTPSVELAGKLSDVSGVETVTVTHTYVYQFAGERHRHRERYVIRDPGSAFSQRLFLGIGTNRIQVRLADRTGNVRSHELRLKLRDGDAPTIRFTRIERIDGGERVRVAGVASDDVKLRTVGVTGGHGNSERLLLTATGAQPDPDRRTVRFETTVPAGPQTGRIRFVATDYQGASTARSLPNEYGRPVAPDLRLDGARTRLRDGRVTVRGAAFGGEIKRVTVETRTPGGERVAFATVHAGAVTRRVEVSRRLGAAESGRTVVRLRVVDAAGQEHTTSLVVGERASATATPTAATATATTTPTAEPPGPGGGDGRPDLVTAGVAGVTLSALAAALVLVFR